MSEEENYIIENETQDTKKKQEYWNTGIGLNKVDNLEPSKYLIDLSKKNINGELKYSEVENLLKTYYETQNSGSGTGRHAHCCGDRVWKHQQQNQQKRRRKADRCL